MHRPPRGRAAGQRVAPCIAHVPLTSPPPTSTCEWWGGVRGGGKFLGDRTDRCSRKRPPPRFASLTRCLPTLPTAARGEGGSAERRLGAAQRLGGIAGRVDLEPIHRSEIIVLLRPRHRRIGIGGIALACADAGKPRRQVGGQEQPVERGAGSCFAIAARSLRCANTASTIAEWPAAITRRALSASTA